MILQRFSLHVGLIGTLHVLSSNSSGADFYSILRNQKPENDQISGFSSCHQSQFLSSEQLVTMSRPSWAFL